MPVRNEDHWKQRIGERNPCWSGNRWLDRCVDVSTKRAMRRIWPDDVGQVLDVGCGDGRMGAWIARAFDCEVFGVDPIDYGPLPIPKLHGEAEDLPLIASTVDMILLSHVLVFTDSWETALIEAMEWQPKWVLVIDNLMTPTPPWLHGLEHFRPIELPALLEVADLQDWYPRRIEVVDVLHRRLFLDTPEWSHPAMAAATMVGDWIGQRLFRPEDARHAAVLLERKAT